MASIDLPRALQDYFAFAETTPTRNGRRFSITLPYLRPDGRLDRLQWWYHVSPAKEKALGDSSLEALRALAIKQFRAHIERWLQNTAHVLYGDGAIPQMAAAQGQRIADSNLPEQDSCGATLSQITGDAESHGPDMAASVESVPAAAQVKTAFG